MTNPCPAGRRDGPERYEIRLGGHLDARWSAWFDGVTVTNRDDGTAALRGPVVDQPALHGLLQRVRDTGLPLISVSRLDAEPPPGRGSRIPSRGMTTHFVVSAQESDRPWQVLAGGERTGGQVVFGEALIPPMTAGPSLHVHTREDEAAYVLEGVLTVRVGERRFEVASGSLVWLPRNEPHTFANLSDDPVRVLGVTTPAGLEGMFREQAEYFATLTGPPDEDRVAGIGRRYGVTVVGPGLL